MFRCINAKIEGNKTMRFPLGEGDQTPLGQGLFWRGKDKNNQFQDFHSGANINKFHGIYYQEQTSSIKSIKKPSLTCTYEQQDKGYFALAMGRRGVRKVNASAIKQDRLWDNFYNPSLFACEPIYGMQGANSETCQFSLKTY
jgi:hypothetical protein